jgi:leucyl aminopeptidase
MILEVTTRRATEVAADSLGILLCQTKRLPRFVQPVDAAVDGMIRRLLETEEFRGKSGELFAMPAPGLPFRRLLLLGLGEEQKVNPATLRRAAATAVRNLMERRLRRGALLAPTLRRVGASEAGQALAEGAILGSYRFDQYRTGDELPKAPEKLILVSGTPEAAAPSRQGVRVGTIVAESTNLARDLSNEPGSVHTPAWLAGRARALGREVGLRVRVLGPQELEREKMGGILAVGRGSEHPPRLIVVEYRPSPARRGAPTVALVGKGITFDSGGISLKSPPTMPEMKHDMSGGATVFGTLRAAALLRLPLHLVGIVAAAENMPDARAYLPGDVVHTASGKTVEVLNTDAEGRIVLADALHYAHRFEPAAIIDVATLTGACVIALGTHCSGLMGNDEALKRRAVESGDRTGERAWPLPLWDEYKEQIKGQVADLKNTGGREGSTILAGAFLSHFVGDRPWIHLDIAGTAHTTKGLPDCVPGATGVGVRLLVDLLQHWGRRR